MSTPRPDTEAAARAYQAPTGKPAGRRLRVEIPVIRSSQAAIPGPSIGFDQHSAGNQGDGRESVARSAERSPFRTGFGLGLGFATGAALFRLVAVLLVYGITLAVLLTILKRIF